MWNSLSPSWTAASDFSSSNLARHGENCESEECLLQVAVKGACAGRGRELQARPDSFLNDTVRKLRGSADDGNERPKGKRQRRDCEGEGGGAASLTVMDISTIL